MPPRRFQIAAVFGLAVLLMSGCASVRLDVPVVPSHAIADGAGTALGRAFAEQSSRHPNLSGFQVVALGDRKSTRLNSSHG